MSSASLLYCVGATKAGTSWLYRYLHDHPACHVSAIKEAHYWDTFGPNRCASQIKAFERRAGQFATKASQEAEAGNIYRSENLFMQREKLQDLIQVLSTPRDGDRAYWDWLSNGAGRAEVVADITPAYGLVNKDTLKRMSALRPVTRFVYMLRDPLDRLWSNIRMAVSREAGSENFDLKANERLASVLAGQADAGVIARSDYRTAITKLQSSVSSDRLYTVFTEELISEQGLRDFCAFVGVQPQAADTKRKIHEGPSAVMDEGLAARAVQFLKDQYEWVAQNLGPLPQRWQDNLARAAS